MDHVFHRCKGCFAIADDMQVYGNETSYDMYLHEAMEMTRQAGLKLIYDKCGIKTKSCKCFGNIYTPQGVMLDPKKVEAIKRMQASQTKQELQSS